MTKITQIFLCTLLLCNSTFHAMESIQANTKEHTIELTFNPTTTKPSSITNIPKTTHKLQSEDLRLKSRSFGLDMSKILAMILKLF